MASDPTDPTTRLNTYTRDEWRDVARALRPDWTDADFNSAWEEFQAAKAKRKLT